MTPYLTSWSSHEFLEIKTTKDFVTKLLQYIKVYFHNEEIHSLSLLLHFPGASDARQWSHIDGTREMWQGSVMCGDGFASTFEFAVQEPIVSTVAPLQKLWSDAPIGYNVFEKMAKNKNCIFWLEKYGQLLNHKSIEPLNSLQVQKINAPEGWESCYLAGTVLRMPGDTIHAGPPSPSYRCRAVFFFSASGIDGPKYDRHTQWNELTLTLQLLTDLWSQLSQLEKVYLLRKVGKIQANPDKAPSDCSMFLSNMTLRLFVRISIYYKLPRSKKKQKVYEDFLLAVAKKGIYQRKSS
jgi:hypothetical protein